MYISANTIIKKLKSETEKLTMHPDDIAELHDTMQRIHLLSELWMEAYQSEVLEGQTKQKKVYPSDLMENDAQDLRSNDDDGMSIFDF